MYMPTSSLKHLHWCSLYQSIWSNLNVHFTWFFSSIDTDDQHTFWNTLFPRSRSSLVFFLPAPPLLLNLTSCPFLTGEHCLTSRGNTALNKQGLPLSFTDTHYTGLFAHAWTGRVYSGHRTFASAVLSVYNTGLREDPWLIPLLHVLSTYISSLGHRDLFRTFFDVALFFSQC